MDLEIASFAAPALPIFEMPVSLTPKDGTQPISTTPLHLGLSIQP